MAAITQVAIPRRSSPAPTSRGWIARYLTLFLAGVFFLVPLYAALRFALKSNSGGTTTAAFRAIPSTPGFGAAFGLSLRLAVVTTVITLGLMVPTAIYVHLKLPALRRLLEAVTVLPIVVPPVVLIVGVLQVAPSKLKSTPYLLALEYVVLALPFAYRALDAGLRALDLRTLTEASASLGGGTFTTLFRVVVPNLKASLLSATVLTVALVLGEFTMASLDQYETFPVWIVNFDQDDAHISVAVSLLALVLTWLLLIVISALDRRRAIRSSIEPNTEMGVPA